MARTVYLYLLTDPESGQVRYVGKTMHPDSRLASHLKPVENSSTDTDEWVRELVSRGLEPIMTVIKEGDEETIAAEKARAINYFLGLGAALTNKQLPGKPSPVPDYERLGLTKADRLVILRCAAAGQSLDEIRNSCRREVSAEDVCTLLEGTPWEGWPFNQASSESLL